jgi:hypothetical protein
VVPTAYRRAFHRADRAIHRRDERIRIFAASLRKPDANAGDDCPAPRLHAGALTFAAAESGRTFSEHHLILLLAQAAWNRVAALAVDNARLYREAQRVNGVKDEFLPLPARAADVAERHPSAGRG